MHFRRKSPELRSPSAHVYFEKISEKGSPSKKQPDFSSVSKEELELIRFFFDDIQKVIDFS